MKKLFYLLLALPLAFVACEEPEQGVDDPVKDPVLNVTETTLNFEAQGGAGVINYTVENAVEGTEVEATCEAAWVADLTVAETITFNVAANDGEAREATITVAYGELSKSVTVKQAAKGEEPKPNTPVFEAVTATVEYEWNTAMGQVEYKLENPIEGVEVKAKSDVMWISQLQAKDGKIVFALAENKGEAREGKITAEYGMLPAIEFTVKQGAYVAPAPVVTITEESVTLAYDATEGSFTYTVENPVEGVVAEATTDAEWVSNLTAADGTVSFTTSVNEGFVREATITVTYGEASDSIVVKQGAANQNPDLDYYAYGIYTFEAQARTADTWDIIMSELHPERGQMFTRITVKLSEDNTGLIPTGEYSSEDGSILVNSATNNSYSTWRYNSTATDITFCELYVENDLEAHTSYIEGMFQVGNEVYGFSYEGAVDGFMYEELGEDGVTNWTSFSSRYSFEDCYILSGNAEGFTIELYIHEMGVTKNNHGTVPAVGTYPVLNWMYSTSENYCEGVNGGSKVNGIYLKSEGQVVIEEVAEGYKVTFDVVDNNGTAWKGTYTGTL
ncbi:MAG: BACON domain-containing protein [Alistipes sp.]|nr:BACON domain-containing protein [Alistipes sp.]